AHGVTVDDTLPTGVTWSTDLVGAVFAGGHLTASLGDLGPGASVTFHISAATDPNEVGLHTDGCKLRNEVVVAATHEDAADQTANSAPATILVTPVLTPADIISPGPPPVIPPPPPPPASSSNPFEFHDGNLIVDTAGDRDWANANALVIGLDLPS